VGSDPNKAGSLPVASMGTGLLGVNDVVDTDAGTQVYHSGTAGNINDGNLSTSVDTYNDSGTETASFVGVLWSQPLSQSVTNLELTMATFFDGGWFGVNNLGPGGSGFLTANDYLIEPTVQTSTDGGTTWTTVACTSDYITVVGAHQLPVDWGAPTSVKANFTLTTPATGINGIRIIGSEGGTASGGFLGVFELAVQATASAEPEPATLLLPAAVGGQFQFQFDSQSGTTYVVQYKNSLADVAWQTLSTISGDGARKTVTDPVGTTTRFYRISSE